MYTILWEIDCQCRDKNAVYRDVLDYNHDATLILFYDLYRTLIEGASQAVDELKKLGYGLVMIEEMSKIKDIVLNKMATCTDFVYKKGINLLLLILFS